MPHKAKSHDDFCGALCLMCLQKGPQLRTIQSGDRGPPRAHNYAGYIKQLWWEQYDSTDTKLPRVICMNCTLKLINHIDHLDNHPELLPLRIEYEKLMVKPQTRQAGSCDCDVCLTGRFTFKQVMKPPHASIVPPGQFAKAKFVEKRKLEPKTELRFTKCHQIVGKGIKHNCNRLNKQKGLDDLLRNVSAKSRSKVVAGRNLSSWL